MPAPHGHDDRRLLPAAVADALSRGMTVLTGDERSARSLRHAFDHDRHATGETRWAPAEILSLDAWERRAWHRLTLAGDETRLLLNPAQEHAIWLATLAEEDDATSLRSLDSVAGLAAAAWSRLVLARGLPALAQHAHTTDTLAFARWAAAFERLCRREGWLSGPELAGALAVAIVRGAVDLPAAGLALLRTEPLTPAQNQLLDTLAQAGCELREIVPEERPGQAFLLAADDEAAELAALEAWVRSHLAENPQARLTVLVPDLEDRRVVLERALEQATGGSVPIECGLGRPLDRIPAAAAALSLLRWAHAPLPLGDISALLLSPWFGGAPGSAEAETIAAFDACELRRQALLRPELSLNRVRTLLERSPRRPHLGSLPARCGELSRQAAVRLKGEQGYAAWVESFRALLEVSGWTAATARQTFAQALQRRFDSALDEVATLDFTGGVVTCEESLAALAHVASQTMFALATEAGAASIQLAAPTTPLLLPGDALWFAGADDIAWPMRQASHPLLPWTLQHTLGLLGTDSTAELDQARALTRRIAGTAPQVVFSYARRHEEEQRRPSPALEGLDLAPWPHAHAEPARPAMYLSFEDRTPLPALADPHVRGGARVLELQAACAFRAFAEHRLFSREPGSLQDGLDALERGTLVHAVMQIFWQQVGNQSTLLGMDAQERTAVLESAIEQALIAQVRPLPALDAWDRAYLDLENQRLIQLLLPWLALEAARPPFIVLEQETRVQAVLGPLRLDLRVDRIDLTEGGRLILDYKTGPATAADWCGDRPEAPQLPLYAAATAAEDLGGVAFALLRAGTGMKLEGMADETTVMEKPFRPEAANLSEQVELWRTRLEALAVAFAHGTAPRPLPRLYPRTCQRCGQRMVCRLDPTTLAQAADDEEGASHG